MQLFDSATEQLQNSLQGQALRYALQEVIFRSNSSAVVRMSAPREDMLYFIALWCVIVVTYGHALAGYFAQLYWSLRFSVTRTCGVHSATCTCGLF